MEDKTGKLVALDKYNCLMDAEMDKNLLEANGIAAMVTEENNPFNTTFNPARLMVMDYDLEIAKQIISEAAENTVEEEGGAPE